jgi:sulfonate transport system ATP-binding protein
MAPRPGRIKRIVDVALPRPRDRNDPRFIRLREAVLADFAERDNDNDNDRDSRADDSPHGGARIPVANPPITEWRLAW